MNDLIPFEYNGFRLRTFVIDGVPMLHHGDVCRGLEHTNPSVAIRLVEDDDKRKIDLREISAGGDALNSNDALNADAWVLTESGFYDLVLASKAKGAKAFKRWVTHDVLPTIRRTGAYGTPAPRRELTRLELIDLAREAEVGRLAAEQRVAELAPKAQTWDALASAEGDYSLREAAQILDRDPTISTGQNRLARYLREIGWCDKQGMPYQRHVDCGRLAVRARSYDHPRTGEEQVAWQVRVTAKGVEELRKLLAPAPLRLVPGGAS